MAIPIETNSASEIYENIQKSIENDNLLTEQELTKITDEFEKEKNNLSETQKEVMKDLLITAICKDLETRLNSYTDEWIERMWYKSTKKFQDISKECEKSSYLEPTLVGGIDIETPSNLSDLDFVSLKKIALLNKMWVTRDDIMQKINWMDFDKYSKNIIVESLVALLSLGLNYTYKHFNYIKELWEKNIFSEISEHTDVSKNFVKEINDMIDNWKLKEALDYVNEALKVEKSYDLLEIKFDILTKIYEEDKSFYKIKEFLQNTSVYETKIFDYFKNELKKWTNFNENELKIIKSYFEQFDEDKYLILISYSLDYQRFDKEKKEKLLYLKSEKTKIKKWIKDFSVQKLNEINTYLENTFNGNFNLEEYFLNIKDSYLSNPILNDNKYSESEIIKYSRISELNIEIKEIEAIKYQWKWIPHNEL